MGRHGSLVQAVRARRLACAMMASDRLGADPWGLADRVLYADAAILVLDKPTGLPVHKGTKTVDDLERHLGPFALPGERPPRLVHRLDKDTSGCLVLARTAEAAAQLGRLFAQQRIGKIYWAVVGASPPAFEGEIDRPLRKVKVPGLSKMVVDPDGQRAVTRWTVIGRSPLAGPSEPQSPTLLALEPLTGRMHQIRAHLAALGCPVLGDRIYGPDPAPVLPLCLHARSVTVPALDDCGRPVAVSAAPPPHIARYTGSMIAR